VGEEVELDEAQKKLKPSYWKAEWRLGTQSEVDKNNKKIFDKLAKTDPVKAAAFHDNLMRMKKKDVKEEIEQVDELNKSTLASYVKKATRDVASASRLQRGYETDAIRSEFPPVQRGSEFAAKTMRKLAGKRSRGIAKAVDKLAKEEVESVEESVATAQKVMDRAKVVANTNPDPKKRFAASGLAQKAMLRTINPTGVNTGITRGGGNKTYRMVTGKVPPYQLTKKTGVSEEVEQVDEANTRVVNKEVKKEKAAETAVAAARRAKNSKNKVETEPRLDMDVDSSEKKYVTKV
jgi:hypothetical protein